MYNAQFVSALKEALNGLRTIHAVGEEWCSYIGQIPVGGVPYCGQEVTRSTYSALWQYAQNQGLVKSESEWQSIANAQGGNVPFYSSGDGSSTFRMPRLVGYVKGASSQAESGAYVAEGLPDHKHYLTNTNSDFYSYYGTNYVYTTSTAKQYVDQARDKIGYASEDNPIYGNSSHVTPETSCVLFGVYAFGEVSNVDALDAGTLASAVARVESNISAKVDKSSPHIVETWESADGYSGYRLFSDGSIEQWGRHIQNSSQGVFVDVILFREMVDDKFRATVTPIGAGTSGFTGHVVRDFTTTGFRIQILGSGAADYTVGAFWEAKGYAK